MQRLKIRVAIISAALTFLSLGLAPDSIMNTAYALSEEEAAAQGLLSEQEKRRIEVTVIDRTIPTEEGNAADIVIAGTESGVPSNSVQDVLNLINSFRDAAKLNFLELDATLCEIAEIRAKEIIEKWDHTRPDGTNVTALASSYGLRYIFLGENIAKGQSSAKKVVEQWMNSKSHRDNILESFYSKTGIAVINNNGILYWVQIFSD